MTIMELIRSLTGRDSQDAPEAPAQELSDEYLANLQRDVDAKLKKGIHFRSVSRASW